MIAYPSGAAALPHPGNERSGGQSDVGVKMTEAEVSRRGPCAANSRRKETDEHILKKYFAPSAHH